MRKLKFIFLFLFFANRLWAADSSAYLLSNRVVSLALGMQKEYDSYLSPLLYEGFSAAVYSERLKYFSVKSDKYSWYSEGVFRLGIVENPAKNANMFLLTVRYFWGTHYHVRPLPNTSLLVGTLCNMDLGGRLQTRNQNNPYSLNWNANLWASVMGYYHLHLRRITLTFREHFTMPFVGIMFSPNYGQTYYEIFGLGYTENVIKFTSFGGRLAWRNKLTVDIPVPFCTFRTGFLAERIVTKMNNLETRSTDFSFLVGLVYSFSTFRGNKSIPKEFRNPTE